MKISTVFFGFLIWASLVMLISLWIGSFALLSLPVLAISAVAAFFLMQRFPLQLEISTIAIGLALLMIVLVAYPLLLVHPFFPASSDVLHVTNVRILTDHIPATYAPYSDLAFTYQIGFALFSNALTDLLPMIPDYQIIWVLGVFFSGLIVLLMYWLVRQLTQNENAALLSAILVFGAKFVFTNFYYGVFPLVASFAFLLAALFLFEIRHPLVFLAVPATIVLHPFTGSALIGILAVLLIWRREWKWGGAALASALLALPSLLRTYSTVISNAGQTAWQINPGLLAKALALVPFWLGWVPFTGLVLALVFFPRSAPQRIWIWLTVLFGVFSVFFISVGLEHAEKFFWLFSIFSVISAGLVLVSPKWNEFSKRFSSRLVHVLLVLVLLVCIASFFFSGELSRGRAGSKATVEHEQFALAFKTFDPTLKKTVFLSEGAGWITAIANKIPLDVRNSHFIPDSELQVVLDLGWQDVLNRNGLQKKIESGCTACVLETGAYYLAVNRSQFSFSFGFPKVFEYGAFDVYKIGS